MMDNNSGIKSLERGSRESDYRTPLNEKSNMKPMIQD